ncbi:MAG TPA: RNA polymerase sigma factor, partial [Roseiflexaceae bacterium]
MSSEGDRLLIQQIRQGDSRAWENLIVRYEGRLLAFVERRLHDRAASEDVVQETFIGFLNSLPHFDDRRELQTYLFTIASHKLTDHLRR